MPNIELFSSEKSKGDLNQENIQIPPIQFESVITLPSNNFQKIFYHHRIWIEKNNKVITAIFNNDEMKYFI